MAQCVILEADGTVSVLSAPASECPGFVLLSGSEYVAVSISQGIFAMPTAAESVAWFGPAFSLVVGLYVVGRFCGAVVNMFR